PSARPSTSASGRRRRTRTDCWRTRARGPVRAGTAEPAEPAPLARRRSRAPPGPRPAAESGRTSRVAVAGMAGREPRPASDAGRAARRAGDAERLVALPAPGLLADAVRRGLQLRPAARARDFDRHGGLRAATSDDVSRRRSPTYPPPRGEATGGRRDRGCDLG